jgi:electron transport complex protein RnfB
LGLPEKASLSPRVIQLHAALPQTQCTRCGYPDCLAYAKAIDAGEALINQCPPGGQEGIERLAAITGQAPLPLNPANGQEEARHTVWIDENWCIGCTLCIKACPVDAIVGANKRMHTIIESQCTGCDLCLPVCPVDCILVEALPTPLGQANATAWGTWSQQQADASLNRYTRRQQRLKHDILQKEQAKAKLLEHKLEDLAAHSKITDPAQLDQKKSVVQQALEKARARLVSKLEPDSGPTGT